MFNLFGLKIHLYGLLIGLGVWAAIEIALARKKTQKEKQVLENVLPWAVLGGVIGARLYHVIDFWTRYYASQPIKVFYVWEGGLGIWGAILGGIVAIYLYCLRKKLNLLQTLDDLIIGVPLAQAIGRVGNRVNGELFGKNGEPLFAYEAVLNLILFGSLLYLYRLPHPPRRVRNDGFITGVYLIGYGLIRIFLEGMRPDDIIWKIGGVPTAIIFGMISICVGLLLFRHSRPDRESI